MRQKMIRTLEWFLLGINNYVILKKGLFGRSKKYNPLSELYTSWIVGKEGGNYDWRPLFNVILFLPMIFLLQDLFPKFFSNHKYIRAAFISFFCSLFLESVQLISCLGTFQISDLVYNTISGMLGVVAYQIFIQIKLSVKWKLSKLS